MSNRQIVNNKQPMTNNRQHISNNRHNIGMSLVINNNRNTVNYKSIEDLAGILKDDKVEHKKDTLKKEMIKYLVKTYKIE